MQPQIGGDALGVPGSLVLAHDSRRFDGHLHQLGVYVRALESRGLQPRVVTCVDPSLRSQYPDWGTVVVGRRVPGGGALEMGYNRLFPIFTRQLGRLPERILHVNDVYLAGVARYRSRVIVSVADLAKLYTHLYPRIPSWIHNRNVPSLRRAQAVVCHSQFVRGELLAHARIDENRIHMVPLFSLLAPPGGEVARSPQAPSESSPWNLLYVATDRPHKNIHLFLEILSRLGSRFRGTLVSRLGPGNTKRAAQLALGSRLTVLSDIPRMEATYAGADILVFPSLYEGFGAPLVEAMAFGVPVIARARAAIPETVGTGGQVVGTDEVQSWCEAVERLTEPQEYLRWSERALRRTGDLGPGRTAEALLRAYRSVV